jgi:cell division ATPase FtsA
MKPKFFKPKEEFFLAIDIGTDAVKCIIFNKNSEKIIVLGAGLEYFDRYGAFNGRYEAEMIEKAIKEAIGRAYYRVSFSTAEKSIKQKALNKKNWNILISPPPNVFKARIISQSVNRENHKGKISFLEEGKIQKGVLEAIEEEISHKFADEFGILPRDISWIFHNIIDVKIDGYSVKSLKGHEGKEIGFKIFTSFIPSYYSESIKNIISSLGFGNFKIVHLAKNIGELLKDESAVVLDAGGEVTQIFGIRNGELQDIKEFKGGGRFFIKDLSETLGLSEESSRVMAENYSNKRIERLKEIFSEERNEWYNNFRKKFDSMGLNYSNILLLGGGSLFPEIKEILTESSLKAEYVVLKDLTNIEDTIKILDNPQWIPSLLICYNR